MKLAKKLNLAKTSVLDFLNKELGNEKSERLIRYQQSLKRFLKTGESSMLVAGQKSILTHKDKSYGITVAIFVAPKGAAYVYSSNLDNANVQTALHDLAVNQQHSGSRVGIVIPSDLLADHKRVLLLDADTRSWLVNKMKNMPVASFRCLSRFYNGRVDTIYKAIGNGDLVLLDYTKPEVRSLSNPEKKLLSKQKPLTPPVGFSLVSEKWHRSGTTLFLDRKKEMCILMGQDEGTYFGVELPSVVSTIADAYQILIPKEVSKKP